MPNAVGIPLCLQPTGSSSSLLSSLSSCEGSLGSEAAALVKKSVRQQTKKRHDGSKSKLLVSSRKFPSAEGSITNIDAFDGLFEENRSLKVRSIEGGDKDVEAGLARKEGDESVWPVLVAIRCRPRKRQKTDERFTARARLEEWRQRSETLDSSSSVSSSDSDETRTNCRSSSGSVQRGVLEYAAYRDYIYQDYDSTLPRQCAQRPRRLYVQTLAHTGGSVSGRRSFDFDFVFPPWKKQREVYNGCVRVQIDHVLRSQQQGNQQHATIVAYGQTGTGKTYTMGMLSDFTDDNEQGLIPRALSQILEFAASANATVEDTESPKTVVTLSFLQIYLETIQDLLALPASSSGIRDTTNRTGGKKHNASRRHYSSCSSDLPVRQERDGAFYVTGLSEYDLSSIEDAHALLALAMRNRVLAATTKNKTSSRSHTLLTISIKQRRRVSARKKHTNDQSDDEEIEQNESIDEGNDRDKVSTISFVDLAGSERVDGALHFLRATRTRQEQRIREAKFINRSLSALGGVIAALAQPKPTQQIRTKVASAYTLARLNSSLQEKLQLPTAKEREQHIRFRDSQLTKLLQGRLMGGRGRLLLIATVDDQPKNLSETLSTLKFAAQCRRVELRHLSRLRGGASRSQDDQSLLDQVFKDMNIMHENRQAALHLEYQTRIKVLEHELEAARAVTQSSTARPIYLASYTALCSLVDSICTIGDHEDQDKKVRHPSVDAFQSAEDMLQYVAGLYSQLKDALVTQPQRLEQQTSLAAKREVPGTTTRSPMSAIFSTCNNHLEDGEQAPTCEATRLLSPPTSTCSTPTQLRNGNVQLSADQEAEFRAVARHLISTHALDSIIVSSDDDDTEY